MKRIGNEQATWATLRVLEWLPFFSLLLVKDGVRQNLNPDSVSPHIAPLGHITNSLASPNSHEGKQAPIVF